jgi:hypothetical protein
MPDTKSQPTPWFTAHELAKECGSTPEKIEALARSNHWPRVHGPEGAKYPMDLATVRRALLGTPRTVHGSIPIS